MSSNNRRIRSWEIVKEHDLPVCPNLPPAEGTLRSASELVDRALCLCSAVAVAYGFPTQKARSWLNQERLVRQAFPGLLERRHALEWAIGAGEWDEVCLDT